MKPLTAEEIAELREAAVQDQAPFETSGANRIGELTMRLLDEVERGRRIPLADEADVKKLLAIIERSRALLKRIEWQGAHDEPRWCPVCGGRETHPHLPLSGHRPGCELAALLGVSGDRQG